MCVSVAICWAHSIKFPHGRLQLVLARLQVWAEQVFQTQGMPTVITFETTRRSATDPESPLPANFLWPRLHLPLPHFLGPPSISVRVSLSLFCFFSSPSCRFYLLFFSEYSSGTGFENVVVWRPGEPRRRE
mmetsp:Transcript_2123/g.5545  ORF Transcript_2123/g.5545 Transcript_2123/m.5545 type:complete len:131 (+) Transcript_2123:882-1274(+)